ncbi:MAG: DUF6134 family protein [Chromatiaceae bacterium]|jgi:hypothetical protein
MNLRTRNTLGVLGALLISTGSAVASPSQQTLRFKVFLDQSPIGEHNFELTAGDSGKRVVSRAEFDVKLLFFNAYRYRHESREQWRDGCLERIQATTDDNGTDYRVQGRRIADVLSLQVNGKSERLPACVSTFAYWEPDFLKRPVLLNPQTGELVDVKLEAQGWERKRFGGREVDARRYRLRADDLDISLWYTTEGDWIGLESDTGKGKMLRYERM